MAIRSTPQAELDLDRIAGTFAHVRSAATALRFIEAVETAVVRLEEMPTLGALRESVIPKLAKVRTWTIRRFPNYVIFYLPISNGIKVLRVLRGSQEAEDRLLEASE